MPDTTIPFDTLSNQSADEGDEPLMTGAQMRELLAAYEAAGAAFKDENGYVQERDEKRVSAAFNEAQERLLYARTVDPEGIAIKIKVLDQRGDIAEGLLPEVFEDLMRPRPAPSLVNFCKAISAAAAPHTEEGGGIKSRIGLADALIPLLGNYTIAEAVHAIALLRMAYTALGAEDGDDPMFATLMLLEDFACGADAADADSAAARADLIEKSQNSSDGWDLGPENMAEATRQARRDLRSMRKGIFDQGVFGDTFEAFFTNRMWRHKAGEALPVAAE